MASERRLESVLDQWQLLHQASRVDEDYFVEAIESLVRQGRPMVPALRALQRQSGDRVLRGNAEFVIALIAGKVDRDFVSDLLRGDRQEKVLGCRIIGASGDKTWGKELDRLQYDSDKDVSAQASVALASVFGVEALDRIEAAQQRHPGNSTVDYVVQELQSWLYPRE